ncbi:unnamed protein product [Linum tenue]|uniref:Uncharacterized protein n=1 Tax=Linum tenue TaxID=586396 RepID=A0AAV0LNM1_9ROSI|nr:unnamed protein product [Linum tenue]
MRYSIFNLEVIKAAVKVAKQEGVSVSLDLASFEVHRFKLHYFALLVSGPCFHKDNDWSSMYSSISPDGSEP